MQVARVKGAYFDRVVLRYAQAEQDAGRTILLVTDDRELRIRYRGLLRQGEPTSSAVMDASELDLGTLRATRYFRCCLEASVLLAAKSWKIFTATRASINESAARMRSTIFCAVAAFAGSQHDSHSGSAPAGAGCAQSCTASAANGREKADASFGTKPSEVRRCHNCNILNRLVLERSNEKPRCGHCHATL